MSHSLTEQELLDGIRNLRREVAPVDDGFGHLAPSSTRSAALAGRVDALPQR